LLFAGKKRTHPPKRKKLRLRENKKPKCTETFARVLTGCLDFLTTGID
jgi:hypothetical protein